MATLEPDPSSSPDHGIVYWSNPEGGDVDPRVLNMTLGALRELVASRGGQNLGRFDAVATYMGQIVEPLLSRPSVEAFTGATQKADAAENEPWLDHCLTYAHHLFGREITPSTAQYFPGFLLTRLIPHRQSTEVKPRILKHFISELELYLQGLSNEEISTRVKDSTTLAVGAHRIKILESLRSTYSFAQLGEAFQGYVNLMQQRES
jgi:hypothetical protein